MGAMPLRPPAKSHRGHGPLLRGGTQLHCVVARHRRFGRSAMHKAVPCKRMTSVRPCAAQPLRAFGHAHGDAL